MIRLVLVLGLWLAIQPPYLAAVTVRSGEVEMDWSNMKVRFTGQAIGQAEQTWNWRDLAESALNDGLVEFVAEFPQLRSTLIKGSPEQHRQAAYDVASTTYITKTEFFETAAVTHQLESSLTRALMPSDVKWASLDSQSMSEDDVMALVLHLPSAWKQPFPIYEVYDEQGNLLWGINSVSQEGYSRNLMGRWFDADGRLFRRFIGKQSLTLEVQSITANRLVVKKSDWLAAQERVASALKYAKIAILQP